MKKWATDLDTSGLYRDQGHSLYMILNGMSSFSMQPKSEQLCGV